MWLTVLVELKTETGKGCGIERKRTIQWGALLVGVGAQGSGTTTAEIGELEEES